jgi:rhamnose transport system ATP-binding protein
LEGLVDTVTVLRDGRHVATRPAGELTQDEVVRLMVGRSLGTVDVTARRPAQDAQIALRVEGLGQQGVFENVAFEVREGEILGLAGLVGAGRSEIAQTLFGATPPTSGRVFVYGREIHPDGPRTMLKAGLAYLPEDRDGEGLVTRLGVGTNLTLAVAGRLARLGFLRPRREQEVAARFVADLQIKTASLRQPVASLSGGNRQKVVLGKWLARGPRIFILDEPTHGIDVGTKAQVHQLIADLARNGLAVILISSDLPEVLAISDRILVVADGRITDQMTRAEASQERIMRAASLRRGIAA